MAATGASNFSLPPVLWNALCASCCMHEGTVSIAYGSLIQFNQWACGWSRCVSSDSRKIGRNMMQFQDFLMSVAPLFQHESRLREHVRPDQRIFNASVIPVLLHDCHGQVLTCSEWQHVESTVLSKLMLSLDDRPAKRPALGSGSGSSASASSSASAATGSGRSHEHGESRNGFAQAFTSPSDNADEDDDVPIAARAPTHAHTAASSDTRVRDVQISVLEGENRALRLLLQSKEEKIKHQKKVIKLWQTKSWRNQKLVQRFKSTVESQLIQTNSGLGLEVSRVQTQKSTQKKSTSSNLGNWRHTLKTLRSNMLMPTSWGTNP